MQENVEKRGLVPGLNRRRVVGAATGAMAALAVAGPKAAAFAQASASPAVWLDMDQNTLDDAYDQSKYAPNMQQLLKRYDSTSELARQSMGSPKRLSYGAPSIEGIDLFATKAAKAPINVFVHGGAWRSELAEDFAFPAELFVTRGAHFLVVDFSSVLETNGNLTALADQVRRAVAWIHKNASTFGGDPDRLFISGHSSGAHLASVAFATDWPRDFGLPADTIKGGLFCSGMYDLKPVRLSARSKYVSFTDTIEQALSPQRHLDRIVSPMMVAYGTLETPEFQRQAKDFASKAGAAGKQVELLVAEDYNHFEIIETLASPYGILGRAVLAQMKL